MFGYNCGKQKRFVVLVTAIILALICGLFAAWHFGIIGGKEGGATSSIAQNWQTQYDLGVRYLEEGNYQEAIIAFTAAIEIDPMQTEAYLALADVYVAQGDLDAAIEILTDGYDATGDAAIQERLESLTQAANTMHASGEDYEIKWVESVIEQGVRALLNKPDGVIMRSELDEITELYVYGDVYFNTISGGATGSEDGFTYDGITYDIGTIYSADDFAHFQSLTTLYLLYNQVQDISALAGLSNLVVLNLGSNAIDDISPLAGLTGLTTLSLWGNEIADINSLGTLAGLVSLMLSDNNISDIGAITSLGNLTTLTLTENNISDISALAGLVNLTYLNISGNNIVEISALAELVNLTYLSAYQNNITDVSPLSGLTALTGCFIYENAISDVSAFSSMSMLMELRLHENNIVDITPLATLSNLTSLSLNDNQIVDITPLAQLNSLTIVWLHENEVADWSPVAHVETVYGRPE